MAKKYDLVVVGAGTAALGAATRVRKAGGSVAAIDFRPIEAQSEDTLWSSE